MKSSAQNQILRQLELIEIELKAIDCLFVKTTVLNLWQIILPDGISFFIEHVGGGHWVFRAIPDIDKYPQVRQAVLKAIAFCCCRKTA